jgi:septum formation protein
VRLVLASTSPARLATLRAAGIEPVAIAPGVDEDAAVAEAEAAAGATLPTPELVQLLARLKAEAVLDAVTADPELADCLVLGGDSNFELDGVSYGKPHTPEVAAARWQLQRGRTGVLHSGHWLVAVRGGAVADAVGEPSAASVSFAADLTDDEIAAYIATGEPLAVAGAFTIDSLGAAFIDRIDGDPSTVVGLSVPLLRRLAARLGVAWPELWTL